MPIPNSVLGSVLPDLATLPEEVFPSRATLRYPTVTRTTTGQNVHGYTDSTAAGLHDLPCRLTPVVLTRPHDQETQKAGDERATAIFQLNFASYIAVDVQVLLKWQVAVDGMVYQIKSAEYDGNRLMTRMLVFSTNQFEA